MDYEKEYKELLAGVKEFKKKYNLGSDGEMGRDLVKLIEPESEDEKMWKVVMSYIPDEAIRFWLEKQKEQSHALEDYMANPDGFLKDWNSAYDKGFEAAKYCITEQPEKYGLCKSAEWSEEDEENIESLILTLNEAMSKGISCEEEILDLEDWLKSLRPRPHWKPSEEQMDALDLAIGCWDENCSEFKLLKSIYTGLKKLTEE